MDELDVTTRIEELCAEAAARPPRTGLLAPTRDVEGSDAPEAVAARVHAHAVIFAGAGRAALLQLLHPWVAAGVREHSVVTTDPLGRFRRTFSGVLAMLFGEPPIAAQSAREVAAIHARIFGRLPDDAGAFRAGTAYAALDRSALRWVHATLLDTSLRMYALLVRPLTGAERAACYAQSRRFAGMFGLRERDLPEDIERFEVYFEAMCDGPILGASDATRELARGLFLPHSRALEPAFAVYRRLTGVWLPPRLRTEIGLPAPTRVDRLVERVAVATLRTQRRWPRTLRLLPAYLRARERALGEPMPALSRWIERALFVAEPGRPAPAQASPPTRELPIQVTPR